MHRTMLSPLLTVFDRGAVNRFKSKYCHGFDCVWGKNGKYAACFKMGMHVEVYVYIIFFFTLKCTELVLQLLFTGNDG